MARARQAQLRLDQAQLLLVRVQMTSLEMTFRVLRPLVPPLARTSLGIQQALTQRLTTHLAKISIVLIEEVKVLSEVVPGRIMVFI